MWRPTLQETTKIHVGLDAHKESITVAAAGPGRLPGRVVAKIVHDVAKLLKTLSKVGPPELLHVVYEAGPTGYGLQRALQDKGVTCEVIAPSQMPKRPAASRVGSRATRSVGNSRSRERIAELVSRKLPVTISRALRVCPAR